MNLRDEFTALVNAFASAYMEREEERIDIPDIEWRNYDQELEYNARLSTAVIQAAGLLAMWIATHSDEVLFKESK